MSLVRSGNFPRVPLAATQQALAFEVGVSDVPAASEAALGYPPREVYLYPVCA